MLNEIIKELEKNNGCNLDVNYNIKKLNDGYMVSLANYETIINLKNGLNDLITQKNIYDAIIEKQVIINNLRTFTNNRKKSFYIGLWINEGLLYIDISINLKKYQDAYSLGIKNNQFSIYDLKNDKSIELKKDVYIVYYFDKSKNDIKYMYECLSIEQLKKCINISRSELYNCLCNSVDEITTQKLYKNYAIIKDTEFYRELY